ncbi:MAG: hypothetical protein ABEJ23_00010 [Haloarculaceae archaeon]
MPSSTRRTVLAAVGSAGAAALAGCADLGSRSRRSYALDVDRLDHPIGAYARWQPDDGTDHPWAAERRAAWEAAVTGERYTTYGYPPLPDEEYTEREGRYYRLHVDVTGSERIERSVLRLRWVGRAEDADVDAVPYEGLPPLDRRAVVPAYVAARARENGGGAPWAVVERGGAVYRHLDDAESELAPTPGHAYVAVHGTVLAVEVSQERLVEPAYTATATQVADSPAAFERVADAALVDVRLAPRDLSAAARDLLVRTVGGDAYREETPLSEAYRDLLAALDLRELLALSPDACRGEVRNDRYLRFDGDYHRYACYVNTVE